MSLIVSTGADKNQSNEVGLGALWLCECMYVLTVAVGEDEVDCINHQGAVMSMGWLTPPSALTKSLTECISLEEKI